MSAVFTISGKFSVLLWQVVTVQFSFNNSIETGLPSIALLPTTTAFLPESGILLALSSVIIPSGVAL